jgi:hypothetical protein
MGDLGHQFPGNPDPAFDLKAAIQVRIVDQSLPANGRSGFFEVLIE